MTNRLLTVATSVVAAGAVCAGVSIADEPGHYDGHQSSVKTAKPKPSAKPKPKPSGEDLTASRLSWSAYLTGAAEVDDNGEDAGDPDAKGTATFLQIDEKTVCYGFTVRGMDTPTLVHIHKGKPGENGAPVVTFANLPKGANGAPAGNPGASAGCKTVTAPAEVAALARIRRNPSNYYLNFHSQSFPAGAVRGQLSRQWYSNKG